MPVEEFDAEHVQPVVLASASETLHALQVACPVCESPVGKVCSRANGGVRQHVHPARMLAANSHG